MSEARTQSRRGRPRKPVQERSQEKTTVTALDRGLRILMCLADSGSATLTELADLTQTPPSTTFRILGTLEHRGMIKFIQSSGVWEIGPQAFHIGNAYRGNDALLEVATPVMQNMSKETGETSNLAVEDDGQLLYLLQVESRNPIRASIKNGAGNHFHTSGVGKVIMAYMEEAQVNALLDSITLFRQTANSITDRQALVAEFAEIRARGWGLDDGERFIGMRCIAAPIFETTGKIFASVSISGPSARFADEDLARLSAFVTSAAKEITKGLKSSGA